MSGGSLRSPADEMAAARTMLAEGRAILPISPRVAAREAYLAMLHAAHARIASDGREVPKTHLGVGTVLGDIYRGTGYPAQALLSEVENWKMSADYGRGKAATADDGAEALAQAERFLARMIANIPPHLLVQAVDPADLEKLRDIEADTDKP